MSKLDEELDRLDKWLVSLGDIPPWNGHVLAEGAHIEADAAGRLRLVMPCDPVTPAEYSVRLEQILQLGPSWLNFSAIGLIRDRLVVSVEWQTPALGVSVTDVSINFSGPPRVVSATPDWDLQRLVRGT
jgi:hypothetical protein